MCSVQSLSRVWLVVTPWTTARQASLSITNSQRPPKPMSIESVMPSNPLIFCRPLLLPSIFPSMRVFSDESALHIRWPKYWSFSFNIGVSVPSNEHPGLISFRMDWLGLLLQHHSSKASILLLWAFFIVQLSHPCVEFPKRNSDSESMETCRLKYLGAVKFWLSDYWSHFTPWKTVRMRSKEKKSWSQVN